MSTRTEHHAKIAEARNVLGEVISRARFGGEATVLINRRKEAAVIVPFDFYERALDALGERPVPAPGDVLAAENIARRAAAKSDD